MGIVNYNYCIWEDRYPRLHKYTMYQRIQQSNYNIGRVYHIECGEKTHPATILYYSMHALRNMNN